MVTAQEEMIQRIDHDLDDTLDNTKKAQDMSSSVRWSWIGTRIEADGFWGALTLAIDSSNRGFCIDVRLNMDSKWP